MANSISSNVKRGSAELAILSVLETGTFHGYEMAKRIEQQTGSAEIRCGFAVPTLISDGETRLGVGLLGAGSQWSQASLLQTHGRGQEQARPLACAVAGFFRCSRETRRTHQYR